MQVDLVRWDIKLLGECGHDLCKPMKLLVGKRASIAIAYQTDLNHARSRKIGSNTCKLCPVALIDPAISNMDLSVTHPGAVTDHKMETKPVIAKRAML